MCSSVQEIREDGYRSKLHCQGTAGFSPCFHLPGFYFEYLFLTHTQITDVQREAWTLTFPTSRVFCFLGVGFAQLCQSSVLRVCYRAWARLCGAQRDQGICRATARSVWKCPMSLHKLARQMRPAAQAFSTFDSIAYPGASILLSRAWALLCSVALQFLDSILNGIHSDCLPLHGECL